MSRWQCWGIYLFGKHKSQEIGCHFKHDSQLVSQKKTKISSWHISPLSPHSFHHINIIIDEASFHYQACIILTVNGSCNFRSINYNVMFCFFFILQFQWIVLAPGLLAKWWINYTEMPRSLYGLYCYSFSMVLDFIYLSLVYVGKSGQIISGAGTGELRWLRWASRLLSTFLLPLSLPSSASPANLCHSSDGSDKLGEHIQRDCVS